MPRKSNVKIALGGAEYTGWQSVDIDSDIFTPADGFNFSGVLPSDPEFRQIMREGVHCDVYIDDDRQMAGVIDTVEIDSSPESARVTVAGRDIGAYLVDNEAKHFKAAKYTIKTLIEALLRPEWGIRNVILSNEDNRKLLLGKQDKKSKAGKTKKTIFGDPLAPRTVTKIDHGKSLAMILDERTRQLQMTWWITAQGDLFIGRPNYSQEPAYEFRCYAKGSKKASTNNCKIRIRRSIEGRYSKITMNGQGGSKTEENKNIFLDPVAFVGGETTTSTRRGKKFSVTAEDPDLVARNITRELIIVDNDALTQSEVQKHVDFDMSERRLNALRIYVTYPSMRYEENDRLFATDTLAHVEFEEADISGVFYVVQRRNIDDGVQQRTELTLVEKDIWP